MCSRIGGQAVSVSEAPEYGGYFVIDELKGLYPDIMSIFFVLWIIE